MERQAERGAPACNQRPDVRHDPSLLRCDQASPWREKPKPSRRDVSLGKLAAKVNQATLRVNGPNDSLGSARLRTLSGTARKKHEGVALEGKQRSRHGKGTSERG